MGQSVEGTLFSLGRFLRASRGGHPSRVWTSLPKKGLRWQVGNGNSILVWGDRWVPGLDNFSIPSPPNASVGMAKVADLFTWSQGSGEQKLFPLV